MKTIRKFRLSEFSRELFGVIVLQAFFVFALLSIGGFFNGLLTENFVFACLCGLVGALPVLFISLFDFKTELIVDQQILKFRRFGTKSQLDINEIDRLVLKSHLPVVRRFVGLSPATRVFAIVKNRSFLSRYKLLGVIETKELTAFFASIPIERQ